jgi:hypothetical protein
MGCSVPSSYWDYMKLYAAKSSAFEDFHGIYSKIDELLMTLIRYNTLLP